MLIESMRGVRKMREVRTIDLHGILIDACALITTALLQAR